MWRQTHHELTLAIYRATDAFSKREIYGLTSQMRRAAVSIASNICEGCGRGGWAELIQFCQIAFGSLSELEFELLLARNLSYLDSRAYRELESRTLEVNRMLASFLSTLRARAGRPRRPAQSKRIVTNHATIESTATDALTH